MATDAPTKTPAASKDARSKKSTKTKDGLSLVEFFVCAAPIVVEVVRIVLDGGATPRNMGALALVALFGLSALVGQKWAVRFAAPIFLAAMGDILVFVILTASPMYYWVMMGLLSWCAYEIAVAKDVRANLLARA